MAFVVCNSRMSGVYKRRLIPVLQNGETVAVSTKEKADVC